MITEDHTSNR